LLTFRQIFLKVKKKVYFCSVIPQKSQGTLSPVLLQISEVMISKANIEALVAEVLDAETEFLVAVNVTGSNHIVVVIDGDNGVPIKRCVEISRHIEGNLDREIEDFELEVSSAGVTSPLLLARQYIKNVGRMVDVLLNSGENFQGKLIAASETHFSIVFQQKMLVEGTKKKQLVDITKEFEYSEVKSTTQVILFR